MFEDRPRSLGTLEECKRRLKMISEPHVKELTKYVRKLRRRYQRRIPKYEGIPYFDPLDGGVNAQVLFLLEKPGRETVNSGFISRNNDDDTAEHTLTFMRRARIPREITCLWNVVPFWNGTRKVTPAERELGIVCLADLLKHFKQLQVIMLVGTTAHRALPQLSKMCEHKILKSWHPSPLTRKYDREKWNSILYQWKRAYRYLVQS